MKRVRFRLKQSALVAASVALIFADSDACANPSGAQVVNGAVSFARPNASTLNVTNSPGAIINWQGFSIGASEVTRFIQQSAASAVLNRVVGGNISQIQGQLLSNGRVFLINPSGIVVGPGAIIDTAGFVGSTLNMLDADFLAGKLKFQGDSTSGSIVNQGWIRTSYGGQVILVAPQIENSGLIHTPGGELILAAGQKLSITSLDLEGVQFEVQAPSDSVVNVGKLLADGGAVGVFAGTLRHSGEIRANALVYDEAGRVVLKARNEVQLAAGSTTSADGRIGGKVTAQSSDGSTLVAGSVSAQGSAGGGGSINLLGNSVAVIENAALNASGATGGGQILVGGDYQGANTAIQNSLNTAVGSAAVLRADATGNGDGGRIIVWSDDKTQFYGSLSARGGPDGGNGGFAEVSGKGNLIFAGAANLGAPQGALGTLLLDPPDVYIFSGGGLDATIPDPNFIPVLFPNNAATVSPTTLAGVMGNVSVHATRYMRISDAIDLSATPGQTFTATVGTYAAPALTDPLALNAPGTNPNQLGPVTISNLMEIGANITTAGGAVSLSAPRIQSFNAPTITTAGGAISLSATGSIAGSSLALNAGSGAVSAMAGTVDAGSFLQLSNLGGGSIVGTAPSFINTGTITTTGAVSLTSSTSSINTSSVTSGGGNVTMNAASSVGTGTITSGGGAVSLMSTNSSVFASGITAGSGAVALSGTGVSTGVIDTTSTVSLTAVGQPFTSTFVSATVDNASSVTASATSNFGSASVNLSSNTVLNATSATATTTQCSGSGSCSGASVTLNGNLGVNVGTVSATAPVSFNNTVNFGAAYADQRFENLSESVSVSSNMGPIRALSGSSSINAANVSLGTGLLSGGGIGLLAAPLAVNVKRSLSVNPNGEFNVQVGGTGLNSLSMQIGVAPATQSYSGTLARTGQVDISVSATDATVTTNTFNVASGFDQRIFNGSPSLSLRVPNGNLVAPSVSVPKGDVTGASSPSARFNCDIGVLGACPPAVIFEPLPVTLRAGNSLTVNNYTREVGTQAKSTTFQADLGTMTLGTINANRDSVSATAFSDSVSVSNLSTAGSVSVTAGFNNLTVDRIDTTSGTGSVSLSAQFGAVQAQTDSGAVEVTSGSSINVTANTIGASTFGNPLDLAGSSVTLTSQNFGGQIGFAGAPVVANTQNLTINAANPSAFNVANGVPFNVSTGPTALRNLTVTAHPGGVGSGGLAQVHTEVGGANDRTYSFASNATDFTFNAGTVPATQFAGGTLSFTSMDGNITLGNANLGTGALSVSARDGSISAGIIDGASITLAAGTGVGSATPVSITTGNIGAFVRPASVSITSGATFFGTDRAGSVTTGTIDAGTTGITSFSGNVVTGNIGTTSAAGAITVTGNRTDAAGPGTIQVGNINTGTIALATDSAVTAGNIGASTGITLSSLTSVTTGSLDAPSIIIGQTPCICSSPPAVTVTGAIGAAQTATNISIGGSTVTVTGTVAGKSTAVDTIDVQALTGTLNINGGNTVVTGGDGSTITLRSSGAGLLAFSNVNAGATGTVNITSGNGIRQVGAGGITAKNVTLSATVAGADIDGDPSSPTLGSLQLNNTKNLTVNVGGSVDLNANGTALDSLTITTSGSSPDTAPITFNNSLGASQSMVVSDNGSGDFNLAVSSTGGPLALTFNANGTGIRTAGSGIATGGGNVSLSSAGGFVGTTGGIMTLGGSVGIQASGAAVTTGTIDTSIAGNGAGAGISISTFCAGCNITVNNSGLNTGTGGAGIFLGASDGNVTRALSVAAPIVSDASVTIATSNGDIGINTAGGDLLVTSPSVTLSARRGSPLAATGNVFATLTGTSSLNLTADNSFSVSSNTTLSTLSLTTRGTGTGTTLNLAAPSQSYSFARPAADLFAVPLTNTFQVVSVGGATPPTTATFAVSDGDLFVGGPGTIAATNLTLSAQSSTSDLKLQGTTASPLSLSNTTQNFSAGRDLLIRGNVSLTGSTSQSLFASGNLTAQAEGGTIAITGNQSITTSSGSISLLGGTLANETVTVSATGSQNISTNSFGAGSILLQGGTGAGSSVTISHSGSGSQSVTAGGNITLQAGGDNAIAAITNTAGSQYVAANTDVNVRGGAGTGAVARISNTSTSDQTIGESRGFSSFQTNNLEVKGGAGSGAFAEIVATAGPQQIYSQFGTLNVEGGTGANATAKIESASTNEQQIGFPDYFCCGNAIGTVIIKGGAGTGSFAHIDANGFQRVTASSSIALTGTTTDAHAMLSGATQDIRRGNITLTAGAGNNANALIASDTTQFIDPSNVTLIGGGGAGATATAKITATGTQQIFGSAMSLTGGPGANSVAQITTAGSQTINFSSLSLSALAGGDGSFAKIDATTAGTTQTLSGGSLTMTAGGAGQTVEPFVAVPNASAIIEGHSQSIFSGTTTLNGGAGASGATSDAIIRNLSGNQTVSAGSITLNGGHTQSTTGVLQMGTGTQSVSGSAGITLRSDPNLPPAHVDSFVLIQNPAATQQTITANSGGVTLTNSGAGTVAVTSAGTQAVTSRFVDVTTSAGSTGNATLSSTGNQRIHATNENATRGLRVAALGTGTASIESGASQLLEVTYPEVMQTSGLTGAMVIGDVNAAGVSRVKAVDQSVFAGSIVVQSGAVNSLSELKASGAQTVSTLTGGISILGGSGDNSLAQIDPTTQTILSNGTIAIQGGSGVNSIAQIVSGSGQTVYSTNGNLTLTGGTNTNADALITNVGPAAIVGSTGNIVLTAGSGSGADALVTVGAGAGSLALVAGGTTTISPNLPTSNAALVAGNVSTGPTLPTSVPPPLSSAASAAAEAASDSTQLVLALQEDQEDTRLESEPTPTADEEGRLLERAPICR
jgi:filamentous hemagglutinin family protein